VMDHAFVHLATKHVPEKNEIQADKHACFGKTQLQGEFVLPERRVDDDDYNYGDAAQQSEYAEVCVSCQLL